jgi:predicted TIM-barrel fold metal-dependent hydrolase
VSSALATSVEDIQIIDVDSHVTEPPDLWTSRLSWKRWGDLIPHVRANPDDGEMCWYVGDVRLMGVASSALAGYKDFWPSRPKRIEDADPGAWQSGERLVRLSEYGIQSQVIYPNVLAFHTAALLELQDAELRLSCFQTYNDFLVEFASADTDRLIPLMLLPMWDVDACVEEISRCYESGHRGIVFAPEFDVIGLPGISSGYWDRVFDAAQALDLSINFHAGFAGFSAADFRKQGDAAGHDDEAFRRDYARHSSLTALQGNSRTIAELTTSGLCDRFPRLNFVSVESGFGYVPFLLEALDWQWKSTGVLRSFPSATPPVEVFHRQMYATFWFETDLRLLDRFADNVMFETDYPHPTSLAPGPASYVDHPADMVRKNLADSGLGIDVARKVLHDNAARVYGLA